MRKLWQITEKEITQVAQLGTDRTDQDILNLQDDKEKEFQAPEEKTNLEALSRKLGIITNTSQIMTIHTSSLKRLRLTTDLNESPIPIMKI